MNHILATLFSVLAVGAAWRGARLFLRGVREADHPSASLWVVRGIRAVIVTVAMGAFAGGLLYNQGWLLIFGVVFLGEELYETGFVSLALRAGQKESKRDT
ncbi:MAG TPA: hypothetical protein VFM04_06025 [Candidatus Methylomirabilis sp.]|nr:hypothetical protein [Candidatus Methylomirabilis sp.]